MTCYCSHFLLRELGDTLTLLCRFSVNLVKSHLHPTTRLIHLGALLDTVLGKVFLLPERHQNLRGLAAQVLTERRVSLATLSRLLGTMVFAIGIVPWMRLHTRVLQWFLLPFQQRNMSCAQIKVLPVEMSCSLVWWTSHAITKGEYFRALNRVTVTTDASLFGWGAHLQAQMAQGQWSQADIAHSINWLDSGWSVWLSSSFACLSQPSMF